MRRLDSYTEEEIDAVIDYFDLGFMRDTITDTDMIDLLTSFSGASIVVGIRLRKCGRALLDSILPSKKSD